MVPTLQRRTLKIREVSFLFPGPPRRKQQNWGYTQGSLVLWPCFFILTCHPPPCVEEPWGPSCGSRTP